jgi:pyruvate formate lyase activating enzyme
VNASLAIEEGRVRFPKEHRPGIPLALALDVRLAKLLGYYCAEGCVSRARDRVHSATLNFSFGHHENALADEVLTLLRSVFGVHAQKVYRTTTIGVAVDKASVALCFAALCGHGARDKRVPALLYEAPREVAEGFLRAYAAGDGHTRANGLTQIITVSEDLAFGVAWLALKLGMLPSVSAHPLGDRLIQGRRVNASATQYAVNWYFGVHRRRFADEHADYWYVRLREIETFDYEGDVYNLEVEGEHSYLANLISTHNCQNWVTSQALRDPASELAGAQPMQLTPQRLVGMAKAQGATLVGSSYNEPLITSEWAVAVFKEAVRAGLKCVYVSNGNATRETLEYIRPYVAGYKIDLKSMSKKGYQQLGGVLENTLNGIKMVHEMGFWLEIVTLVIPGFNDSDEELMDAARYLAALSPDIPWHVTAFHKDYKMTEPDNTTTRTLIRAAEIGEEAGLRYVYAGNLPGQVGEYEHTFCPNCRSRLIQRYGYIILEYRLTAQGTCPDCGTRIAGLWTDRPETVRLYGPGHPRAVTSRVYRYRSDTADT